MLISNSDGCCLDGLIAAILLRAAAMIAVEDGAEVGDGWSIRLSCGSNPGECGSSSLSASPNASG